MKEVFINKAEAVEIRENSQQRSKTVYGKGGEEMTVSDGYHTFDELYDHRITLYIALCKVLKANGLNVWRATLHSDLTKFDGWFVLGIGDLPGTQITYHIPLDRWEETNFAWSVGKAPEFDGHTPADVIERLKKL